jgi:hypothetical protein
MEPLNAHAALCPPKIGSRSVTDTSGVRCATIRYGRESGRGMTCSAAPRMGRSVLEPSGELAIDHRRVIGDLSLRLPILKIHQIHRKERGTAVPKRWLPLGRTHSDHRMAISLAIQERRRLHSHISDRPAPYCPALASSVQGATASDELRGCKSSKITYEDRNMPLTC